MIDGLNNATTTRAAVLRQIVESAEVSTKYNHQAYAVMEYFGYSRVPTGFGAISRGLQCWTEATTHAAWSRAL